MLCLVKVAADHDLILDIGFEPHIRKIKSVQQSLLFSAIYPPDIQPLSLMKPVSDGTSVVLKLHIEVSRDWKICEVPTVTADSERPISLMEPVSDGTSGVLKLHIEVSQDWKICEVPTVTADSEVGSLRGLYISSFQSASRIFRICLFIVIVALLIPRSCQLPMTYNATEICPASYQLKRHITYNAPEICPAPYQLKRHITYNAPEIFPAPYQFKRPVRGYGAPLFDVQDMEYQFLLKSKDDCTKQSYNVQVVSTVGAIISFLTNFAPLLPAVKVRDLTASGILVFGLYCLLISEANLSWFFYMRKEECASTLVFYLALIAFIWNLLCSCFFWIWSWSSLKVKQSLLTLLVCVTIGLIGYVNPTAAGIFGLILLSGGHTIRIMSLLAAGRCHWFTFMLSVFGFIGSGCTLYQANFGTMTVLKIASSILFAVRVIDIPLQLFLCCHKNEQNDTNAGLTTALLPSLNGEQELDRSQRQEYVPHANEQNEGEVRHDVLPPLADTTITQYDADLNRPIKLEDEKSEVSLGLRHRLQLNKDDDGYVHGRLSHTPRRHKCCSPKGKSSGSPSEEQSPGKSSSTHSESPGKSSSTHSEKQSSSGIPSEEQKSSGIPSEEQSPGKSSSAHSESPGKSSSTHSEKQSSSGIPSEEQKSSGIPSEEQSGKSSGSSPEEHSTARIHETCLLQVTRNGSSEHGPAETVGTEYGRSQGQ
ncbi:hypothetical protein ACP70R_033768 [Stipagrostis hirtigluma subsp. patula]